MGPPGLVGVDSMGAMGAEDVVGGEEGPDEADSTGGGTGALVAGGKEPVLSGGGAVVPEALGTADEGAPLGVGAVELPFNPAPPSNLPAKHCVMSGTSVSPVGVRERT